MNRQERDISMKRERMYIRRSDTELPAELDRRQGYQFVKRAQDMVLSALAIVVLSPLLVLISLLIMLDDSSSGPVFCQKRCGKNGKEFLFFKFRTMRAGAELELEQLLQYNEMQGPVFKIKEDPRLTRLGKLLRRTSADELPQLFNVLIGNMSLVGPRPPLPREVALYTPYQRQRLSVTPGLTCFWQIQQGRYQLSFEEWVELDLRYIRERSWLLDWKLMVLTVRAILRRDGE